MLEIIGKLPGLILLCILYRQSGINTAELLQLKKEVEQSKTDLLLEAKIRYTVDNQFSESLWEFDQLKKGLLDVRCSKTK